MGGAAYTLTEEAYLTILLHAAKYPSCTICGVLLGQTQGEGGKSITVTTAVPLFHLSMLLAPCVETALSQVEAYAAQQKLKLIGYYHSEARSSASDIHPVAKRIAERLSDRQPDSFMLVINHQKLASFSRQGSNESPFDLWLRDSPAPKAAWKRAPSDGAGGSLGFSKGSSSSWEQLRLRFLNLHAKGQHAQLADFDEHLDDVSRDYLNSQLFSQDTDVLAR